jgi:prevent-host-death family protein
MASVTSADFQRGFGRYREVAQREPVVIASHGRESLVLLSAEEYCRLKRLDREPLYPWELDEADLAALREARAPDDAAAFDRELTG